MSALFDPRDILPETLADDDEELITNPLAERLASVRLDELPNVWPFALHAGKDAACTGKQARWDLRCSWSGLLG